MIIAEICAGSGIICDRRDQIDLAFLGRCGFLTDDGFSPFALFDQINDLLVARIDRRSSGAGLIRPDIAEVFRQFQFVQRTGFGIGIIFQDLGDEVGGSRKCPVCIIPDDDQLVAVHLDNEFLFGQRLLGGHGLRSVRHADKDLFQVRKIGVLVFGPVRFDRQLGLKTRIDGHTNIDSGVFFRARAVQIASHHNIFGFLSPLDDRHQIFRYRLRRDLRRRIRRVSASHDPRKQNQSEEQTSHDAYPKFVFHTRPPEKSLSFSSSYHLYR